MVEEEVFRVESSYAWTLSLHPSTFFAFSLYPYRLPLVLPVCHSFAADVCNGELML